MFIIIILQEWVERFANFGDVRHDSATLGAFAESVKVMN